MKFLDTNILRYSLSGRAEETEKRRRAIALLETEDCALSVQVLQEFYVQSTRATRDDAISHALAAGLIRTWLRFRVQEITLAVMQSALDIKAAHGFSYWDSAIIALRPGHWLPRTDDRRHGPRPRDRGLGDRQSVPMNVNTRSVIIQRLSWYRNF